MTGVVVATCGGCQHTKRLVAPELPEITVRNPGGPGGTGGRGEGGGGRGGEEGGRGEGKCVMWGATVEVCNVWEGQTCGP